MNKNLLIIAENLRNQDNLCTKDPIFCVQGLTRTPTDSEYSDDFGFATVDWEYICYKDGKNLEDWNEYLKQDDNDTLDDNDTIKFYYTEEWHTIQTCFTEAGCKEYLKQNEYNLLGRGGYCKTRIFVESLHRNSEMIEIRNFLMNYGI